MWCLPYPTIVQLEQLFNNTLSSQDVYTLAGKYLSSSSALPQHLLPLQPNHNPRLSNLLMYR